MSTLYEPGWALLLAVPVRMSLLLELVLRVWKLDSEVRLDSELWKVPSAPDSVPKAVTLAR
jgi:hypothetical protein